ncbi:39S mitochondrial ribosomal protein L46-domain-containing protein [Halteromyces radiatus]|uniref:39S mitochondrial ribosomal protein L46-domain-containing protein n=1 Tax=Halteromyces radiatus TaxID=101107 RepID=UPI00221F345D|nr:39S mitochondrial ribosomal protein L46-domain-containing protein [Halteromyces radiatus]KAI8098550.1 39S mitochondrial ribosomal protein L46-domain-containing protein [Halteromyces radiatus]
MLKISQRFFSASSRVAQQQQQPLMIKNSRIAASVILTRGPQITRDATPFERAYFDYKEKQERQASAVFPQDFYFKKGSVAERRWKEDVQARDAAMKDQALSLTEAIQQQHIDQSSSTPPIQINDRITQADKTNDIKKLDRALTRNLYLIVKQQNQWQFPQTDLQANEYLHEAAERYLKESCGKDMDVWFVGRQPVSHYKQSPSRKEDTEGLKIFFMKARVYAGQVKPTKDVSDFAWLTKDELVNYLSPDYYKAIKDSLGDL